MSPHHNQEAAASRSFTWATTSDAGGTMAKATATGFPRQSSAPSTNTVNSPYAPGSSSTSIPSSLRTVAATRADGIAESHTLQYRIATLCMVPPSVLVTGSEKGGSDPGASRMTPRRADLALPRHDDLRSELPRARLAQRQSPEADETNE